jgi:tetratricopeptide (TPR) repeat protein
MNKIRLTIFLIIFCTPIFCANNQTDLWIDHWLKAGEYFKNSEYESSIVEYTQAIDYLKSKGEINFALLLERGNTFLRTCDFEKAVTDFSRVIESTAVSDFDKATALSLRAKSLFLSGKCCCGLCQDMELFSKLDPITNFVESDSYVSLKLGIVQQSNKDLFEAFELLLLTDPKIARSRKDIKISPSGIIIIKKAPSNNLNQAEKKLFPQVNIKEKT